MRPLLRFLYIGFAVAENGLDGWLRYAALPSDIQKSHATPSTIVVLNSSETSPVYTAGKELQKGIHGILGHELEVTGTTNNTNASILVGTTESFSSVGGNTTEVPHLKDDGFWLSIENANVYILGQNERGALYGTFEYLSMLAQRNFSQVAYATSPSAPIRWVNEWDNLDGSIERGFAGPSIFFQNGGVVDDLARVSQYARLLASIRVNGIIVNNVNANFNLLNASNMAGLGRVANAMRPYGVCIGISLNFDSPRNLSSLMTTDELYEHVPDLAGFLVKANSEDQPGPLTYNRTLADGANLFARALKPHGNGIVMLFRAFVYDHHLNESNWKNDRANHAVDFFGHLDGQFDDNVFIQIKYGPIDFQVREPPSPLFANLLGTNTAIELQVTQEYLGQQSHLVYLPPLWKTILDYDLRIDGEPSVMRDILSGGRLNRSLSGYAAVVNVGTNTTWLGSHLAMSNLYAYGRLAWNPSDDEVAVLQDWTRLTFGAGKTIVDTITMESWPAYENYTGNLGIQTLTDILYTHFGPNPASQDDNSWGQWTRADADTIGMDRTVSNGTGFFSQYPAQVTAMYEDINTTPNELLLWFHHVPYTQQLKSGKTVIQHFYDAHYAGAATAQMFPTQWAALEGLVDHERFEEVMFRLEYQAGRAIVWRDAINEFYWSKSGIEDGAGRVGKHPWRVKAEKMKMSGYKAVPVTPFETASGRTAIVTTSSDAAGTVEVELGYPSGTYDIAVNYYDIIGGRSRYELLLANNTIGRWEGDLEDILGHTFSSFLDGHAATRVSFRDVNIIKGDILKIVGQPDGFELAPLDYVAVLPQGVID
ncbi:glycoside hydrolase superfamily [Pseudomassariella vexata]|uniref:Alpha-glucuronidase n=1 Tax=Pseudomassariella vexata TaxID=1141098 RepID=A0A1Y2DI21_9PEZI|nr:glycoside hydrolase superfamily [Pseudomassariella vexata]ORY58892.1 glycoside hydrolase superfamily [Pseudomassariella vexata]